MNYFIKSFYNIINYNNNDLTIHVIHKMLCYSGISIRSTKQFNRDQVQILPFTLLPSSFPRKCFENVKSIQTILNKLIHKVAHDREFLKNSLGR